MSLHSSRSVRTAGLLALLCAAFGTAYARQAGSAAAIPEARLVQPEKLAQILRSTEGAKPLVLQVGPHTMFAEAHPPGAEYVGLGALETGLQALRERVKTVPHDQTIVLYCGCCPWIKCPNVGPAYQQLASLGFQNVKVLFIETNFGADWVSKGYPVEKGR